MSSTRGHREHDKLVSRLTQMLIGLNSGEELVPAQLAAACNVSVRTIQRDIGRLGYLPLLRTERGYRIDPAYLGRLGVKDIERFASLSGVAGLFPSLGADFLRELLDERMCNAVLVKGHEYEDLSTHRREFDLLKQAVLEHCIVSFRTSGHDGRASKVYFGVQPYRLLNFRGIWYLAADHDGRLKTYALSRIADVLVSNERFRPQEVFVQQVSSTDGFVFGDAGVRVELAVAPEVASFFKRRKLLPHQLIESEGCDGGLVVSTREVDGQSVLPIVRYWLPHVRILSPASLHQTFLKQMQLFVETLSEGRRAGVEALALGAALRTGC